MMDSRLRRVNRFFVDGAWIAPAAGAESFPITNPATEEIVGEVLLGTHPDVDRAIESAARAFPSFSRTSLEERLEFLNRIITAYERRIGDLATAVTTEMGAPLHTLSKTRQAPIGLAHLSATITAARSHQFERYIGSTLVVEEPVGVCVLITPWNWPLNQIVCKLAPALAAGCTVVLKPSENAPLSAQVFAEIMEESAVPPGVFNMIHGDGRKIGARLCSHPLVDMVSLTGSTGAGAAVISAGANTIKRTALELGGKSANIILEDADVATAVASGIESMMRNSGQSCNAPSRMLVPASRIREIEGLATKHCREIIVGDPLEPTTTVGPIAHERQYRKVQSLIETGIREGARLVTGGLGRPAHLARGYYAMPTIFSDVRNDMTIAREEIFGPVLSIIPYRSEDEAIAIANDSVYGLGGHVHGGTTKHALSVARQLRTGMVHVNGAGGDLNAPFGGYKQSGKGREWGTFGLEEFLETKAIMGAGAR